MARQALTIEPAADSDLSLHNRKIDVQQAVALKQLACV
jgi:hypothetical protein